MLLFYFKLKSKAKTTKRLICISGGTIDITAHEIVNAKNVKELLVANGGSWGGTRVDENFVALLKQSLGDFVEQYREKEPNQWLTLMLAFEKAKKIVKDDGKHQLRLQLSFNIFKSHTQLTGKGLDDVINSTKNITGISCRNGSLVLTHAATMGLFRPVITEIQRHLKEQLQQKILADVSYVMLVGGFAECKILQKGITDILPKGSTIIPEEAQLAISKGAVKFGLNPKAIESRFARKTYGVDMEPRFRPNIHRADKKVTRRGIDYCNDVFDVFVKRGDSVEGKAVVTKKYFPRHANQPYMTFDIFYTEHDTLEQVEYVDNQKFRRAGTLLVEMPDKDGKRGTEVEVEFKFGGTEIQVSGKDITSGKATKTTVDLLLD